MAELTPPKLNASLPEVPTWLARKIEKPRPAAAKTKRSYSGSHTAYVRAALERECLAVQSAPTGSRNDTLNRAAFSLGQLVGGNQLPRGAVEGELYESCEANGLVADDGEASVRATIRSGLEAGILEPRIPAVKPLQEGGPTGPRGATPREMIELDVQAGSGASYVRSDAGNAERFVDDHAIDVRFVPGLGFLVWDGTYWGGDDDERVIQRAIESMRRQTVTAVRSLEKDAIAFALKSESAPRIDGMLKLARSNPRIVLRADALDPDAWILNVKNGTLDLRTGELRPHRREDLVTHCLPINYSSSVECPQWEAFLARVLRVEYGGRFDDAATKNLIGFVKRAVGYTLTGSTREHVLLLLYGIGANGKSVFLGVLKSVLGRALARTLPFMALIAQRNPSSDGSGPSDHIARLRGARMVESIEANEGLQFNEAMVKALTGGDRVAARHLYRGGIEFDPQFKLWIATNHKPRIVGTDVGIWRRVQMVPFTQVIPEEERDPDLKEKLIQTEAAGILRWAVEGCLEWQRDGLGNAEAVTLATEEYRREQDTLGQFLEERCALGPEFKVRTEDLLTAYNAWARENHEDELSSKALAERLAERRAPVKRTKVGGLRGWCGIGLRRSSDDEGRRWSN